MHDTVTLKNQTYLHVGGISLYVDSFVRWLLISASELQFNLQVHAGL